MVIGVLYSIVCNIRHRCWTVFQEIGVVCWGEHFNEYVSFSLTGHYHRAANYFASGQVSPWRYSRLN